MKRQKELFTDEGHLTDSGIAAWIEAYQEKPPRKLPEIIENHVEACLSCKELILEMQETMNMLEQEKTTSWEYRPRSGSFLKRGFLINYPTYFRVAALLLILVGLGSVVGLMVFRSGTDTDTLYASNFSHYPDIVSERGTVQFSDSTELIKNLAFQYYNHEQYDSAAIAFKYFMKQRGETDTLRFYLAVSILASGQPASGAISLLRHDCFLTGNFREQANWYLSLAYIHANRTDSAKIYLKNLDSPASAYQTQARSLLNALR